MATGGADPRTGGKGREHRHGEFLHISLPLPGYGSHRELLVSDYDDVLSYVAHNALPTLHPRFAVLVAHVLQSWQRSSHASYAPCWSRQAASLTCLAFPA